MRCKMSKFTLLRAPNWHILNREQITPVKSSRIRQDLPPFYHTYTDAVSVCRWFRNHDYWGFWDWVKMWICVIFASVASSKPLVSLS